VGARAADNRGMGRRTLVVGASAVAAVAAGTLVAAFALTSTGSTTAPTNVTGAARVATLLHGIPQHGVALGSPTAPVTLLEFADPQCPFCGSWEREALPEIVRRYVRPGKIRIVFEGMAFVGTDSETALRTALAAAQQNRFWNVLELLYENQGPENSGWVTDGLLRAIGAAVPGLDTERMLADRSSAAVDRALAQAGAVAQSAGVTGTPTFAVGKTAGRLRVVQVSSLTASALAPALDAALRQ
jgi:protein-disulfide isomerase